MSQHGSMTPEEVEVGRRNLLAELKGGHRSATDGFFVNAETVTDLIAVLEAVPHLQVQAEVPDCQACAAADVGVMTHLPHICKPARPVQVDREAPEAALHDAAGIPADSNCPARHPVSGALCIEPPGHESEHRAMGVSRLQWFGENLRESEPGAEPEVPHLITTNNTGYFWCSCSPNHARVFRGLREHIAEIASPAQPLMARQDLNRHAVWRSIYDAAITAGLQPSQIADKGTAAVLALLSPEETK